MCFVTVILDGVIFGKVEDMIFVFLALIISIFVPKILLFMRNGGSIFEYKIFDAMVVKSKDKFINILPNSLKERE